MSIENVGAGILNIITESLYDKPIVVFREYVQNSVDSFSKIKDDVKNEDLFSRIWTENKNLYFLDNGKGINREIFETEMKSIASSKKKRTINMGYKGIGRLSGIPYCNKLIFINICNYEENDFQRYCIDGVKYKEIKNSEDYYQMNINDLMEVIGEYKEKLEGRELEEVKGLLCKNEDILKGRNTGFLVILNEINHILDNTIQSKEFRKDLGWLLPVKFKDELYETSQKTLFEDLSQSGKDIVAPVRAYNITFNGVGIERPIEKNMLRDYTCKMDLKYAVGFHSFFRDNILVAKNNEYYGIKIYIDNMLLCDETEFIPILKEYGLIEYTVTELVQAVKGIGAMIYITDKINISANARRTFIEVTDREPLEFLELLAEFVKKVYIARYALSKYTSGKKAIDLSKDKLDNLKEKANRALRELAEEKIEFDDQDQEELDFEKLNEIEQKRAIKKKITKEINNKTKTYLSQTTSFEYNSAFEDFKKWLLSN